MNYHDTLNESYKLLQDTQYSVCLTSHENKSNEELEKIVMTNLRIIQAIPTINPSFESLKDGQKRMGEIRACKEILEKRKKEKEREEKKLGSIKNAKKLWKNELDNRRKNAILNLPVAVTYNAQLVVAILESEDYKTADEIADYINEISSIEKDELSILLSSLVAEGILHLASNGEYSLLNICTAKLFPPHPVEWATKKLSIKNKTMSKVKQNIIIALEEALEPLTDIELKEKFGYVDSEIKTLLECDVLQKYKCGNEDVYMYYFTMLGEKTRR